MLDLNNSLTNQSPMLEQDKSSEEQPKLQRQNGKVSLQEVNENGDYIFHFKLNLDETQACPTLEEFYRQSIQDLLQLVCFYANGQPVIVDTFAFLNRPHDLIEIRKISQES